MKNAHFRDLGQPSEPPGWSNSGVRVTEAVCDPSSGRGRLVRWVNTGSGPSLAKVDWLLDGVRQGLHAAGESLRNKPPLNGRDRPLVGLPLFGSAGGFDAVRGQVLDGLLSECNSAAAAFGYAVIACWQRSDYAALQARRRSQDIAFAVLSEELRREAQRLGGLARAGRLALFLGAGVSQAAGLPSWPGLIRWLAGDSPSYKDRLDELVKIPVIDAVSLLKKDLGQDQFRASLRNALAGGLHSVGHALLASLRAAEAITTNFDALYEQACAATFGHQPCKLPWQRAEPGRPWLLKMHGDVDSKDLVLSREEFLGYDALWRPLASMVQAAMMTRHVLFVGFSLHDENFVRLARGKPAA